MPWLLLTDGGYFPLVLAYGLAACAFGGFWLGGLRWLLVPPLAMGVELLFAIPATLIAPGGGETPFSVILEAPFWTGFPALLGAAIGAATRWARDTNLRLSGPKAG